MAAVQRVECGHAHVKQLLHGGMSPINCHEFYPSYQSHVWTDGPIKRTYKDFSAFLPFKGVDEAVEAFKRCV